MSFANVTSPAAAPPAPLDWALMATGITKLTTKNPRRCVLLMERFPSESSRLDAAYRISLKPRGRNPWRDGWGHCYHSCTVVVDPGNDKQKVDLESVGPEP